MIEVSFYKNGFEIKGHAEVGICSLVTCMSWTCACILIRTYGVEDKNTPKYSSVSGYTYLVFDTSFKDLNEIFDEFKFCLRDWCEKERVNSVSFEETDDFLVIGGCEMT